MAPPKHNAIDIVATRSLEIVRANVALQDTFLGSDEPADIFNLRLQPAAPSAEAVAQLLQELINEEFRKLNHMNTKIKHKFFEKRKARIAALQEALKAVEAKAKNTKSL